MGGPQAAGARHVAGHRKVRYGADAECIGLVDGTRRRAHFRPASCAPGGGDRDRTCDPLLAKQELYQLSYAPARAVVGLCGLEPQTLRLSGVRSNHLSYRPAASSRPQCVASPGAERTGSGRR